MILKCINIVKDTVNIYTILYNIFYEIYNPYTFFIVYIVTF